MSTFKTIIRGSLLESKSLLPIFFAASLLAVLIELFVPHDFIVSFLGDNLFLSIPLAALLGVLLPIPRYATYPIAFALFMKGSPYGVIFALIAGEVIGESLVRDFVEIKYFGIRFFSVRLIVSLLFIIAGGFLMEAVL